MMREIEPSVQMRLYTLNKCQFVIIFVLFFIAFGITILIGTAGPAVTELSFQNVSSLTPQPSSYASGPFILKSPSVSTFHRQLWLTAEIITAKSQDEAFSLPFASSIQIRGLQETRSHALDGEVHNTSQVLKCAQTCDSIGLLHLSYLAHTAYVITVQFYGLDTNKYPVKDVIFTFQTYNPQFTKLEVWTRFAYLLMTFVVTCAFAHSMRRFYMRDWSMEQKWVAVLLPALLLYNNPLFPLVFLVSSWVPGLLDGVFQATFLALLLLYWLCTYHGMRQTKRRFMTFYLPKVCLVGVIWVVGVALSSWLVCQQLFDPTYTYMSINFSLLGVRVFFIVIGAVYLLYLVYLLIRSCAELRSVPYFDLRLKFVTVFMLLILGVSVVVMVMRFANSTVSSDSFVTEVSLPYTSATQFLVFYGLLNYYVYIMAYVYSPSHNAALDSYFKDNPTISMLNDSDDEIFSSTETDALTKSKSKMRSFSSGD